MYVHQIFKFGRHNFKNKNICFALTNGKTKLKSRTLKAKLKEFSTTKGQIKSEWIYEIINFSVHFLEIDDSDLI